MDLPPVPASVAALATTGNVPPGFTEAGVRALASAYAHLEELADGVVDPDGMDEDNDRAVELLELAEAEGVEVGPELWWYSDHMRRLADELRDENAEMEAYVAEHGTTPRGRLEAKLTQAHDLYAAGDRAPAVALFREVAEISPWSGFSGCLDRIDVGWCRLLHDAAHVEGPEAARAVWREARAHYHAARFPVTEHAWPLVEMLLGTGVPDIIEVIIREWIEAAEEAGRAEEPVTEDEHRVFELALAEIERATSGAG